GGRMFAQIALDPEIDELQLSDGSKTVLNHDTTSLARDGNDIYFAESEKLFRAANADFSAPTMLAAASHEILGFSGDWVYTVAGTGADRTVHRVSKADGSDQMVFKIGAGLAALAKDAVAFTLHEGSRFFVCTVDLQGHTPTILGYLAGSPSLLAADEHYVYATVAFNLLRVKR
ncbi:MAG: hypothetical protein ABJB12_16720, partial [Pseudomonadota bacterium]